MICKKYEWLIMSIKGVEINSNWIFLYIILERRVLAFIFIVEMSTELIKYYVGQLFLNQ